MKQEISADQHLIEEIANGNEFVLKRVYTEYYSLIERMVLANQGDEDDAKDLYQESFLVLMDNLKKPDFELTCRLGTYLYAVARNLWLKRLRNFSQTSARISDQLADELPDVTETLDHFLLEEHRLDAVKVGLEKLGDPCKTILTDFFYHRLSMEEIAQKMGYTNAANAKNQKYKCLNRFKKLVLLETRKGFRE